MHSYGRGHILMHHSGGRFGGTHYFGGRGMHRTNHRNTPTGTNNSISRPEEYIWIIWEVRSLHNANYVLLWNRGWIHCTIGSTGGPPTPFHRCIETDPSAQQLVMILKTSQDITRKLVSPTCIIPETKICKRVISHDSLSPKKAYLQEKLWSSQTEVKGEGN